MGRIAFVFAGQGSQFPGMGKELYESSSAARAMFGGLERIYPGLTGICFSGSEDDLKKTEITQPCMYAVEAAVFAALAEKGIVPDSAAGFSLGEISALFAAGSVTAEEGFRLVIRRGEAMGRASAAHPASMAAVVKLSAEQVENICASLDRAYPVNYNCPGQIVVSCAAETLPALAAAAKEAGGRALPLKVSGGFHSPFMKDAADEFSSVLAEAAICEPQTELYSNVTGKPYVKNVSVMKELLSRQICSPVRWEDTIKNMIASGTDTFVEIGPGKTLCGLIERTDPSVKTVSVCDPEGIEKAAAAIL